MDLKDSRANHYESQAPESTNIHPNDKLIFKDLDNKRSNNIQEATDRQENVPLSMIKTPWLRAILFDSSDYEQTNSSHLM